MDELVLENEILENKLLLIYFEGTSCGACEVIKGKLTSIAERNKMMKFIAIDGVKNPKLAVKYNVFSMPLAILFVEGKESIRFGRNIDLIGFENDIKRLISFM